MRRLRDGQGRPSRRVASEDSVTVREVEIDSTHPRALPFSKSIGSIRGTLRISCAPKTCVASRAIGGVRAPRRPPVAAAVGVVTQVRSSPDHLSLTEGRTGWVVARTVDMEARVEPVRAPLPDIARDVVEPISVRLELVHGCRAEVAILQRVA